MPLTFTTASARFESARHVDVLPQGHRARRVHGHSFIASVAAMLPEGWSSYPGGEVPELRKLLAEAVEPLDYQDLNTVIVQPTDENIARWLRERLDLPVEMKVAVNSTDTQGVELNHSDDATLWRRYRFQAAHRLPNVEPGHKCGRMHGHGFEVVLHTQKNIAEEDLSIDYDHLDRIWAPLFALLDHQCLNEIPGLQNPTSEMISSWLWAYIKPELPQLTHVTVYETASCGATFDGESYRIFKDFTLDSAVQMRLAPAGTREQRLHGHTFRLRLNLSAPLNTVMGWTIDFGDVKDVFNPIFKSIDHQPLYEYENLNDSDTASIARHIHRTTTARIPELYGIDLYETEGCGCILVEGDSTSMPGI